jgi:hypothetical protein
LPFTVSHIAAVVPAYRPLARAHVFSAAVIGSMVPDFGFLLPGNFARWQTHSFGALLSFCLPVGLAAYCLMQWLIRPAVLEVVPDGAYARLQRDHPAAWRRPWTWPLVVVALMFGAVTHLVWDGFTHENARGVRLFPDLTDYGPEMAGHSLQLYRWLQYGSSIVGLVIVAGALALWLYHAPAPRQPPLRRLARPERALWLAAYVALPVAAIAWTALAPLSLGHALLVSGNALGRVAIVSLRASALSLLLISALVRLRLIV